jgi:DNA repair exonuclease SbcCD ATPase subunit
MKIISLKAENIKRLQAVEISPDPQEPIVTISGKNEQGKTSVLDAIWFAIGGGAAMADTARPVRDGAEEASVTLDLGELVVTRRWTGNERSYLKVENKDGIKFNSPQALLDGLAGKLSFDPLAFTNYAPKEQAKVLADLVKFPVDMEALDAQKKELYNNRTLANREVDRLKGVLTGMQQPDPDLPTEELSSADIVAELQTAQATIANNATQRRRKDDLQASVIRYEEMPKQLDAEIAELQARIFQLEMKKKEAVKTLEDTKKVLESVEKQVSELVDPDLQTFQTRLANVEDINRQIRDAAKRKETETTLAEFQSVSKQLTNRLDAIDQAKADALKAAQFPIEGLAFDAEGVTYKGIPFKQCSAAERLRVSLAMAMALNPKLRVIRITDASLLDEDNMAIIREMAGAKDYQVWMEVVDSSGKLGVYIEDGRVKN